MIIRMDVFETDPLSADHPLRNLPHVVATPHLGYVADSNYQAYFSQAVENIAAWLDNKPLRSLLK